MQLSYGGGGVPVRALEAISWGVTAFDWRVAVTGPAWGVSTGEIAHNSPSLPARDGPGAALRQRQRRQDLFSAVEPFGGRLIETNLNEDDIKALRKALANS